MARKETAEYEIKLQDNLTNPLNRAKKSANGLDNAIGKVSKSTNGFGNVLKGTLAAGVIGGLVSGISNLAKEALIIGANFESMTKAIELTSGSSEQFQKNMSFIKESSSRLGLELTSASTGFKTLSAAAMGSSLEGEGVRHVFAAVASATSQLGISADDSKGAFLALGQMISKGKVSAEELRGQLGERLPGAFNIAADAMGVTTMELDKMLQQGKIISTDFLPKFAKALNEKFGDPMETNVKTMRANMNRLKNAFTTGMAAIGQSFAPLIAQLVQMLNWFNQNKEMLQDIAITVGLAAGAFGAYILVMNATAIATSSVVLITKALYVIMNMNPFVAIASATLVLVGTMTALYHTNEKVRKSFDGIWSSVKKVGENIKKFVIDTFKPFLDAWQSFQSGNYGDAAASLGKGVFNVATIGMNDPRKFFTGVGEAYNEGVKNSKMPTVAKAPDTSATPSLDDFIKNQKTPASMATATAGKNQSKSSVTGVSSGRPTTVNVDIGKLIENFTVETTNMEDMEIKIKNAVSGALVSAVNDVNLIAR